MRGRREPLEVYVGAVPGWSIARAMCCVAWCPPRFGEVAWAGQWWREGPTLVSAL